MNSHKHIELRGEGARVLNNYPNTKNGLSLAQIHARRLKREGKYAFVYRVTETRLY